MASATLLCTERALAGSVVEMINSKENSVATCSPALESWRNNGTVAICSLEEAIEYANGQSPEHLVLCVENPRRILPLCRSFGSAFLGNFSAQSFGDYVSGTNHILPTGGSARFSGGLWTGSFLRAQTYVEVDKDGASTLALPGAVIAEAEGLVAHRSAMLLRTGWIWIERPSMGFRSIGEKWLKGSKGKTDFLQDIHFHGYRVLLPSTVQLFGSCWERLSDEIRNRMISLGTPSGETGCLSPDLTLASVSYLSTHFAPEERPLRICYGERVFRSPSAPDSSADPFQLGAELLGWDGEGADVELLVLLLRALDALGVKKSFVVIGDVNILSSLLADLPDQTASALKNALLRQSFPAFRRSWIGPPFLGL